MSNSASQGAAIAIDVFGMRPTVTIRHAQAFAREQALQFLCAADAEQAARKRQRLRFPLRIGTFRIGRAQVQTFVPFLLKLAKREQDQVFCCAVAHRTLDLSSSARDLERELLRISREAQRDDQIWLNVGLAIRRHRTLPASAPGPHTLEVTT